MLIVAVVVLAGLVLVKVWPNSTPTHPAAAGTSAPTIATFPSVPAGGPPPWPTAPEACGGTAELPLVSSVPAREHTGLTLLVGGSRLQTVDFDTGRAEVLAQPRLGPSEYVVRLVTGSQIHAVTATCTTGAAHVLGVSAAGAVHEIARSGRGGDVLVDGPKAWVVTDPAEQHDRGSLLPLAGGTRVRLPANFYPAGITDGVVVGSLDSGPGPGSLLLVDATTGRVRADVGKGLSVAVAHGVVVWTDGCDVSVIRPCTLHRRSVHGARTDSYRLPRPPGFSAAALSPDGRLLAFALERRGQDPRYEQGHPLPPADIAVLHLDTGTLEIVPGIELPAKTVLALAFSRDDRWLMIALDAGSRTRLLAWRSHLPHPYETRPVPGPVDVPAIAVLP